MPIGCLWELPRATSSLDARSWTGKESQSYRVQDWTLPSAHGQPWVQLAPLGAAQGLPTTTGPGNFEIPKGAWLGMVRGRDALPIIFTGQEGPGAARGQDQVGSEDARDYLVLGLGSVESGRSGVTEHCAEMSSASPNSEQDSIPRLLGSARLGRLRYDQDLGELSLSRKLSSTRTASPWV